MNLLVNAYQAVEESIAAGSAGGRVSLRTTRQDDAVHVSVSDDGPGIPAENLERIFDPFFTTKDVGEGTGLGLSTAFQLVRSHGGRIRVESQPGQGTRFEVVLPIGGPPPGESDG